MAPINQTIVDKMTHDLRNNQLIDKDPGHFLSTSGA